MLLHVIHHLMTLTKTLTFYYFRIENLYNLACKVADKILTIKCSIEYYQNVRCEAVLEGLRDLELNYNKCIQECKELSDLHCLKEVDKMFKSILKKAKTLQNKIDELKEDKAIDYMKEQISKINKDDASNNEICFRYDLLSFLFEIIKLCVIC